MKPRLSSPALALICVAVCIGTSGCILGSSKAGDVIAKALPTPNQQLACRDEGIDGPHGRQCVLIVPGAEADVIKRLVNGLTQQGFTTACGQTSTGVPGVEVIGVRPDMRVVADVMPHGFAQLFDGGAIFFPPGAAVNVNGKKVTIPDGSVGLTIDASEYQTAVAIGSSCDDPALRTP